MPMWREGFRERIVLHDFPPARVDHQKKGQNVFHSKLLDLSTSILITPS
jgi:hypothetical protein